MWDTGKHQLLVQLEGGRDKKKSVPRLGESGSGLGEWTGKDSNPEKKCSAGEGHTSKKGTKCRLFPYSGEPNTGSALWAELAIDSPLFKSGSGSPKSWQRQHHQTLVNWLRSEFLLGVNGQHLSVSLVLPKSRSPLCLFRHLRLSPLDRNIFAGAFQQWLQNPALLHELLFRKFVVPKK